MKNVLKKILESIVLLLVSAALWTLLLVPFSNQINNQLPLSLVQNISIFLLLFLLVFAINWYCKKQGYLEWKTFFTDKKVGKWLLLGIVSTVVLHFLVTFVGQLTGKPYIDTNSSAEGYYLVIDVMNSVIMAALVEEIVFRKILTKIIFPNNLALSLTVTGLLFAASHIPTTLSDWVNQLGAALILSIVYYKTRRVEASVLIHGFMNLFVTAIYWWIMYR